MKAVFTTGEAAELCSLSQQTIIRCFDSGRLRGFRVPGSKFRRIPRESLLDFMNEHGIPLDRVESTGRRILLIGGCEHVRACPAVRAIERDKQFELRIAENPFEAGLTVSEFCPELLVVAADSRFDVAELCKIIRRRPEFQGVCIIALAESATAADPLMKSGAAGVLLMDQRGHAVVQQVSKSIRH